MKRYAEYFERDYYFKEWGDFENFFIKLGYVCRPAEFVSGVGNPLVNITASNGNPIFKNNNIDLGKYTLLGEEVEQIDGGWLSVKETYGFAPDRVYVSYGAEPITRPGLKDPSGYATFRPINCVYHRNIDRFDVTFTSVDTLAPGDIIYLNAVGLENVSSDATGPSVAVISISENVVTMPAFQLTYSSGTTRTKEGTALWLRGGTQWRGAKYFVRVSTMRDPMTIITNVKNQITFSQTLPQLDSRLIISQGNSEVDTITDGTNPTITEWKELVANQKYYNVQDATVEAVFPNALYKKTVKMAMAK